MAGQRMPHERNHQAILRAAAQADLAQALAAAERRAQEAERHAETAERRLRALSATLGEWSWRATTTGKLLETVAAEHAFTSQVTDLGLDGEWEAAVHPADHAATLAAWERAVADHTPYTHVQRFQRADGAYRVVEVRGAPVFDDAGDVTEWIGVTRDITAQADSERELRILQTLTDTALAHLSLEDLFHELLDSLVEALGVDNVAILLADADGATLTIRAVRGVEEAVADRVRVPVGEGFAGRIAATQRPLIVDDVARFDVVNPYLRDHLRSMAGVPLFAADRCFGVLHIGTVTARIFTEDDIDLLRRVGDRVALAIDRALQFDAVGAARQQAERSATELMTVFNAITDGILVYDADGRLARINTKARQLFGIDVRPDYLTAALEERGAALAVRDAAGELIPADQWPIARVLRGETLTEDQAVEFHVRDLAGVERVLNYVGAPLPGADGRPSGAVLVVRDVTESRQTQRRTRESLAAMLAMGRLLLEPPDDLTAFTRSTNDRTKERLNGVAQRLAELTRDVLGCKRVGVTAVEPVTERLRALAVVGLTVDQERQWWNEQQALEAQGARLGEGGNPDEVARFRAGEVFVLDMTAPPLNQLPNPYGVTTQMVAPMLVGERLVGMLNLDHGGARHDYTAEDRVLVRGVANFGAIVVERERLLYQRAVAEAKMLALGEANRRMNEFLGIVSHELKTPLTGIKSNLQIVERGLRRARAATEPPEKLARTVESLLPHILNGEQRMERLINELLDISRIREGKWVFHMQPRDLSDIARAAVNEARLAHPGRPIRLSAPRAPTLINGDADRLWQVVSNYLSNALKYSMEDRPVIVSVKVSGGEARLLVRDEGPGMQDGDRDQIWDLFHRVPGIEVLSGSGVGLGLGLHICKTIIERHGGTVGVESVVGQGSTFWFALPLISACATGEPAE